MSRLMSLHTKVQRQAETILLYSLLFGVDDITDLESKYSIKIIQNRLIPLLCLSLWLSSPSLVLWLPFWRPSSSSSTLRSLLMPGYDGKAAFDHAYNLIDKLVILGDFLCLAMAPANPNHDQRRIPSIMRSLRRTTTPPIDCLL
jgi:hypothetical protein